MIRWRHDHQNLSVDFDTGAVALNDQQRQPLEQTATLIRKRCHDLPGPALHVRVSRDERDQEFEVEMTLEAMQRSVRGVGKADNLPEAVEFAREKVISQMGPFKAILRRDGIYRLQQRQGLDEAGGTAAAPVSEQGPELKDFERRLEGYWRPLVRQVSREISALEMSSALPLGELAAQDIVDEVIVRAFERLRQRPGELQLEIWLYQQARQVLAERRKELQRESPISSIPPRRSMKELLPPPASNPLTDAEEILMDILEPEEELLPGEAIAEQAEATEPALPPRRTALQHALRRLVSHLPAAQREAIWLHYLDGFDMGEIAAIQGRQEEEVRVDVARGVSHLRNALRGWRGWEGERRERG